MTIVWAWLLLGDPYPQKPRICVNVVDDPGRGWGFGSLKSGVVFRLQFMSCKRNTTPDYRLGVRLADSQLSISATHVQLIH